LLAWAKVEQAKTLSLKRGHVEQRPNLAAQLDANILSGLSTCLPGGLQCMRPQSGAI
jgi:hypothetical protein